VRDVVGCSSSLPVAQPKALVTVAGTQYWGDAGNSHLFRVSATGCGSILMDPPPMLTNSYPFALAADNERIYFLNDGVNRLRSVPLAGGTATQLATFGSRSDKQTVGIATDGVYVYLASGGPGIYRIPVAGGALRLFTSTASLVTGLAYSSGMLFWTEKATNSVRGTHTVTTMGTGPFLISSTEDAPTAIFADSESLFWTNARAVRGTLR